MFEIYFEAQRGRSWKLYLTENGKENLVMLVKRL